MTAPKITGFSWGRLEVEGIGELRDAKLHPAGGRAWDWRETGTHHDPGIQVADIEELIEAGADVVILTKGVECALGVCPETLERLAEANVRFEILQTEAGIDRYNELVEAGEAVGGLFHSTC